jgi:hypothetical protein
MSDYRPTQADREAAKEICKQFFIVLGNDERTHKLIAAIMAEKMNEERMCAAGQRDELKRARIEFIELRRKGFLADRLADAVEEIKQIYDTREYGNGWIEAANIQLVELLDALAAYREATK